MKKPIKKAFYSGMKIQDQDKAIGFNEAIDLYDKYLEEREVDARKIKKVVRGSRIARYAYSDMMLRSKTAEEAADYYYMYINDLATALAEAMKKGLSWK